MARPVGGRRHLPLRPHEDPRRGLLHRHAAAHGERLAAHRARHSATPTPTSSPATSACAARRSSTRWGGTTTASTSSAASSSSPARSSTPPSPTTPTSGAPRRSTRRPAPIPVSRPNFIELCEEVVPQFEAEYHELWSTVGPVGRLGPHLHHDRPQGHPHVRSAGSCASSHRDLAYRSESPTLWDVDMRTAVAQAELDGPRARRRVPQARVHAAPTAPAARSTPPGPSCCPPAWPSSPTPTTSATSRCSARRPPRRCSASRSRSSPTRLADPEKGTGVGDDLHVRRHHRRHLVARAVAAGPRHRPARRPAAPGHLGRGRAGSRSTPPPRRPPTTSWPARPSSRRRRASSSCSPTPGSSTARSARSPTR